MYILITVYVGSEPIHMGIIHSLSPFSVEALLQTLEGFLSFSSTT
jgi:hypothetical protein